MVANANLFTRDNLVDLIKERNNSKFIINYILKFKISSLALSYFIIYTNILTLSYSFIY